MTSSEVKRLVVRPRFLLVTVGLLVLAVTDVVLTGTRGDPPGFYGVVATTLGYDIQYPILAGIVSADALATDTEAGYTALVLGRDVRRRDYLLHKGMAIMAAAALATMVRHLWILAVAAVVLPWGAPVLPMQPPDMLLHVPGPLPALFLSNPVWNDVLSMFMTAFATGVLATLGLVVAASGGGAPERAKEPGAAGRHPEARAARWGGWLPVGGQARPGRQPPDEVLFPRDAATADDRAGPPGRARSPVAGRAHEWPGPRGDRASPQAPHRPCRPRRGDPAGESSPHGGRKAVPPGHSGESRQGHARGRQRTSLEDAFLELLK